MSTPLTRMLMEGEFRASIAFQIMSMYEKRLTAVIGISWMSNQEGITAPSAITIKSEC